MVVLASGSNEPELVGTNMESEPAPSFTLTDHRGQTVELQDLEGKAVALTFIFTNCPDVCPLIVQRMLNAYDQLPDDTQDDVAMVAVTVDPERDSPQAMHDYLAERDVATLDNWYGLTGDLATLEPIWANYYVTPGQKYPANTPVPSATSSHGEDGHHSGDAHSDHDHGTGEDDNAAYWLAHTDVIYVIDPEGNLRSLMRSDDTPEDLAHNLEALAQ